MKDSTIADLKTLREQAGSARKPFEQGWFTNLSYYQGQQWVYCQNGRLYEPQLDANRVKFVDNRIIGIIRTEIAKMTKQHPVFIVTPNSGTDEDISAALLGERVLESQWQSLKMTQSLRSVLLWARICSAGFWKVYWDKSAGDSMEVLVGEDGAPLDGHDGRMLRTDRPEVAETMKAIGGDIRTKQVAKGELCLEVRSPFELLPDPLAEEGGLDEAEWIIEESVRSVDYIKSRYDKDIEPNADAVSGIAESRMGHASNMGSQGSYRGVKVLEYWSKPTGAQGKGKRVVWTEDTVLYEGTNTYDELPYVMFSGIQVPGRFWPTSTVEQLRPPQTEMNKTRSQIRENAARFGNPALLESRQANVHYTGIPGDTIKFDPTMPDSIPQFLRPPEMPAYVQAELDRMELSLREISGQHEISHGAVPSGVTAASAINLLQESDETRLSTDVTDMEDSLARAGTKLLELVSMFYTEDRTIKLAGDDGAWDIQEFRGKALAGNTSVEVQVGSGMPRSKAAKQAAMQEVLNLAMQYGMPLKPRALRKFFRAYEVGGLEQLLGGVENDERQVNRENRILFTGEAPGPDMQPGSPLEINSYDDDEFHLEGHEDAMKSAKYATSPKDVKDRFEMHTMLHRTRLTQMTQAAAESAGTLAGQLGGGGGPPAGTDGSVGPDGQTAGVPPPGGLPQ